MFSDFLVAVDALVFVRSLLSNLNSVAALQIFMFQLFPVMQRNEGKQTLENSFIEIYKFESVYIGVSGKQEVFSIICAILSSLL